MPQLIENYNQLGVVITGLNHVRDTYAALYRNALTHLKEDPSSFNLQNELNSYELQVEECTMLINKAKNILPVVAKSFINVQV